MARADWKRPTEFPLAPGCRRIRIDLSYDGSGFCGWQRQSGVRTVQEEIEKALRKMLKVPVHVHGSGRTDTGVHAIGQVAHFDIVNQSVPVEVFRRCVEPTASPRHTHHRKRAGERTIPCPFSPRSAGVPHY